MTWQYEPLFYRHWLAEQKIMMISLYYSMLNSLIWEKNDGTFSKIIYNYILTNHTHTCMRSEWTPLSVNKNLTKCSLISVFKSQQWIEPLWSPTYSSPWKLNMSNFYKQHSLSTILVNLWIITPTMKYTGIIANGTIF